MTRSQSIESFEIWLLVWKSADASKESSAPTSSRSNFTQISGLLCTSPCTSRFSSSLTLDMSSKLGKVIIKSAPKYRLDNERNVLKHFHAQPGIRQLMDETQDPPSLVLKHFDDNLLTASNTKRLSKPEIKFVAKRILKALQAFHEDGYVHTGTAFLCFVNVFSSPMLTRL